jgi:UDPglucose 6-dehydrogenase
VLDPDVVFLCLPTPGDGYGTLDTNAVEGALASVACTRDRKCRCYVVKSTVPVGTTRRLAKNLNMEDVLVHSPEFLTERTADADAANPAALMIGSPTGRVTPAQERLTSLYLRAFGPDRVTWGTSDETELAKLAQNAFFAVKVNFFNNLADLCRVRGLSYDGVRSMVTMDGRVGDLHTLVPGPDGLPGCGGKCLPKDTAEYGATLEQASVPYLSLYETRSENAARRGR